MKVVIIGATSILGIVGKTPLIKIGKIYAKLETTNPTGSIKDRMAWYMVKKAEERGELKNGSRIIEVTSGNTGIALAMISAIKGYKFTAVMPEFMSIERRNMLKAFGAEIILTPAKEDMSGAVRKYDELVKKYPNAWLPKQFENLSLIDEVITIKSDDAIEMSKRLAKEHGILVGISSGANVLAAMKLSKRFKKVVTVLPDRGERYLSVN